MVLIDLVSAAILLIEQGNSFYGQGVAYPDGRAAQGAQGYAPQGAGYPGAGYAQQGAGYGSVQDGRGMVPGAGWTPSGFRTNQGAVQGGFYGPGGMSDPQRNSYPNGRHGGGYPLDADLTSRLKVASDALAAAIAGNATNPPTALKPTDPTTEERAAARLGGPSAEERVAARLAGYEPTSAEQAAARLGGASAEARALVRNDQLPVGGYDRFPNDDSRFPSDTSRADVRNDDSRFPSDTSVRNDDTSVRNDDSRFPNDTVDSSRSSVAASDAERARRVAQGVTGDARLPRDELVGPSAAERAAIAGKIPQTAMTAEEIARRSGKGRSIL